MFDVLVIGGGPAGVTAALRCRELGASVALVERGRMGGTCTNDGCVPTRVLARTARMLRDYEYFDEYGLIGERPQLDFQAVMSQAQEIVYSIHEKKQLIEHLTEAGVEVYTEVGPARFVDPHTVALGNDDGPRLEARGFILAVGGHARRLDFPGAELAYTHSDMWNLRELPRSLAIIGAAATGCQLATIFNAFGSDVTLLEVAPRILPGEDDSVSAIMADGFTRRGISIITGISGIERIERAETGLRLSYRLGDEPRQLDVETVIMAVGWPGNLESLALERAGVETARGYIVVDDTLRTSAPHIYAAGDITGRMMLVQTASRDARIAAENVVLGAGSRSEHRIVPHGGFTDPEYGSVGLTEAQAREREAVAVATVPYGDIDRAVIDSLTEGLCKLIVSRATRRLLGAAIVGEQALEVTQVVAAGMAANMTVEQLARLELAYPTYASVVGLAARRILRDLDSTPPGAEWHVLGKRITVEWERREDV